MRTSGLKKVISCLLVGILLVSPFPGLSVKAQAAEPSPAQTREEKLEKFKQEMITVWGEIYYGGTPRYQMETPGRRWFVQKGRFTEISDLELLKLAGEKDLYQKYSRQRLFYIGASVVSLSVAVFIAAQNSHSLSIDENSGSSSSSSGNSAQGVAFVVALGAGALFGLQAAGGLDPHYLTFDQAKEIAGRYNAKLWKDLGLNIQEQEGITF